MSMLSWKRQGVSILLSCALLLSLLIYGNGYTVFATSKVQFSDDFENGSSSYWTATSGEWAVVEKNGGYVYQQTSVKEGRTSAGESDWTDYSVSADVTVDDFNGSNRVYVAGRYTDGNNFYAATLYNKDGGTLEIRKKVNGSTTTIASKKNYGLEEGTKYEITLEMTGSEIQMYVDGTLQLTASDSSLASGGIGLVTYKTKTTFDNVIVSKLDESGNEDTTTPVEPENPDPDPNPEPTPNPEPEVPTDPDDGNEVPEVPGTLTQYNLTGFSYGNTGGGDISETDSSYKKVYTAADLAQALKKNSGVKVIEIMNDLDLGWNELPAEAQASPFAAHNAALTHPVLKETGVSKLYIENFNGLTIFSENGAKIKHAGLIIKRSSNLIIRNLEFDELWEWDEASKGNYDKNDWDYITIEGASSKVWIDHCTFNKAYDGIVDVKKGSNGVTVSWSYFRGDDRSENSWVTQQINAMEADPSSYPMYAYLRSSKVGLSKNEIIAIASGQKKSHLIGATEFASDNANLEITLHHNYYEDIQDRMPRLRGGNAHVYNIVMDSADLYEAKQIITSEMAKAIKAKGYHFDVVSNGAISTEGGAVLIEKSEIIGVASPIRNNQADAENADYTGKIEALDVIYTFKGETYRGDSTTEGSPLAPYPAAAKSFSWNGFSTLPYSYTPDNPASLREMLAGVNGAGAGKLTWEKTNWLSTTYN